MHALRTLCLTLPTIIVLALCGARSLMAYPGDVFSSPAPVKGPNVATRTEVPTGTYSVATKTGAASYSVPIVVPPGRNGMEPTLSLVYSSQNPLRGGVAAGFRLEGIPQIYVDASRGRLAGVTYASSLAGGQRLVEVDEPNADPGVRTFRAEHDSSYARYEHLAALGNPPGMTDGPGGWIVRLPDGTVYRFGMYGGRDQRSAHVETPLFGTQARWFLDTARDRFGNEVRYRYLDRDSSHHDVVIASIDYTFNREAGISEPHARVRFEYAPVQTCAGSDVPIGAAFDYTRGIRIYEGARELAQIVTEVRDTPGGSWRTVRQLSLQYDAEAKRCDQLHAPLRLLSEIRGTGYGASGVATSLPTVTFDYGPLERDLGVSKTYPILAGGEVGRGLRWFSSQNSQSPTIDTVGRPKSQWPTIELMLADLDGDGRLDRLEDLADDDATAACGFQWESFADDAGGARDGAMLSLFGAESLRCGLGHEYSTMLNAYPSCGYWEQGNNYNQHRLLDFDGDRRPDLATALNYGHHSYSPPSVPSAGGPMPCLLTDFDSPGDRGRCITLEPAVGGVIYAPTSPEAGVPHAVYGPHTAAALLAAVTSLYRDEDPPEAVMNDIPVGCRHRQQLDDADNRYVWNISFGDGTGDFGSATRRETRLSPIPLEDDLPGATLGTSGAAPAGSWHGFYDIDGDGLVDAIWQHPTYVNHTWQTPDWQIFRGDGDGNFDFAPGAVPYRWSMPDVAGDGRPKVSYARNRDVTEATTNGHFHRATDTQTSLQDINGDGLVDYVVGHASGAATAARVYFNTGAGFDPVPTVVSDAFAPVEREVQVVIQKNESLGYAEFEYSRYQRRLVDFDGDGLVDVIELPPPRSGQRNPWQAPPATEWESSSGEFVVELPRVRAYLNVGDRFVAVPADDRLDAIEAALARIKLSDGDRWRVVTDFADLDGDGLAEAFNNPDNGSATSGPCTAPPAPAGGDRLLPGFWSLCAHSNEALTENLPFGEAPRLLKTVTNGAGATIHFDYVSSNDGDVMHRDNASYRTGAPMWLVRTLRVEAGGDTPFLQTTYDYDNPVFQADEHGRFGFRGFETVQATGRANASGRAAQTSERFAFDVDPTGRLVATAQWSCDEGGCNARTLDSITDTIWQRHQVFDGAVTTYHPAEQRAWTCAPGTAATMDKGADEICRETGALSREVYGWGPVFGYVPLTVWEAEPAPSNPTTPTLAELVIATSVLAPRTTPVAPRATTAPRTSTSLFRDASLDLGFDPADPSLNLVDVPVDDTATPVTDVVTDPGDIAPPPPAQEVPVQPALCDVGPDLDAGAPTYASNAVAVMYVQCGVRRTQTLGAPAAQDRATVYNHRLLQDADAYLLLTTNSRRYEATAAGVGGAWGPVNLTGWEQTVYDSGGLGLPTQTRVWLDSTTKAVTRRTFDTATGNLLTVRRPEQVRRGSTLVTTNTYDAHRLYVRETIDEVGLRYRTDVDPGTGLTRFAGGPYQPGRGWPGTRTEYDGRGRAVRGYEMVDDADGTGYVEALVEKTTYCDGHAGSLGTSAGAICPRGFPLLVRSEARIEYDEDVWATTDTTVDGIGRPLSSTVRGGTGPAVTTYVYDGAGQIRRMLVPEPSGTTAPGTQLPFDYERDARGRVTRFLPPDGAPTRIEYGLLSVTREQEPSDDSPAARVVTDFDVYGRLVRVEESATAGPAETRYRYDANDNLAGIVDADGIWTNLEHDFVGQRRRIERPGSEWAYEYDHDGNLVRELPPLPEGIARDGERASDFEIETAYDAIGRVVRRTAGTRDLNPGDWQRYGLGDVAYEYDDAGVANGVGRVTRATVGTVAQLSYAYTAAGQVASKDVMLRATPDGAAGAAVAIERTASWTYNALGQVRRTVHADDAASPTVTVQRYDDRGQPSELWLENGVRRRLWSPRQPGGTSVGPVLLARVQRNSAGLPTRRDGAHAPRQVWRYDRLGRVIETSAFTAGSYASLAGERLTYDQVGNVASVHHPAAGLTLRFGYDTQHQLVSADALEDPAVYAAGLTHTLGGRISTAYVGSSVPGTDVQPRDVVYDYAPASADSFKDPAAVRTLLQTSGGLGARYDYDERGSIVQRQTGMLPVGMRNGLPAELLLTESQRYRYDGDDLLREVIDDGSGRRQLLYYDDGGARILSIELGGREPARVRAWLGDTELRGSLSEPAAESIVHASLGGMPIAQIENAKRAEPKLVFNGVLGSLLAVTDTAGAPLARFVYGPFGELLWKDGPDVERQLKRYNGKEYDSLSRLSYYGARYYDRLGMIWTQMDPLYRFAPDIAWDEPRRMGLYVFNLNNPVRYVDPDGLMPIPEASSAMITGAESRAAAASSGGRDLFVNGLKTFAKEATGLGTLQRVGERVGQMAAAIYTDDLEMAESARDELVVELAVVGAGPLAGKVLGASVNAVKKTRAAKKLGNLADGATDVTKAAGGGGKKPYVKPKVTELKETAGSKPGGRKFQGRDDQGPVRVRVDKAHPEDPNYTGPKDPLHTQDHIHVERRKNGETGEWEGAGKAQLDYPFAE